MAIPKSGPLAAYDLGLDNGQGEAVVAFDSYGLDGGGVEAWVIADALEEGAGADDAGIGIVGVDDGTVADDVVGEDEGAGARELDGPFKIVGVVGLVGVEEDEVEGLGLLGVEFGEGFERGADAEVDERGEAGAVDVGAGDGSVFGLELEGDELAVGGKGAGEPDGGVAAEGPDLEDAACALDAGEKVEQLALAGSDVDGGKTGAGVGFEGVFDALVGGDEGVGEVAVDGVPEVLIHTVKIVLVARWRQPVGVGLLAVVVVLAKYRDSSASPQNDVVEKTIAARVGEMAGLGEMG